MVSHICQQRKLYYDRLLSKAVQINMNILEMRTCCIHFLLLWYLNRPAIRYCNNTQQQIM